jgi:multicomponent Na+:H+ antiporter subunit D
VQTALFLVVGLVERAGGSTSLTRLGGLAKATPLLAILFFVPAMNLAGIPPLSGFLGKVGLLEAGVQQGTTLTYILVVGGVVTSLLTLYALVKAWNKAFWQTPSEVRPPVHLPIGMVAPTAALIGVGLLLTFAAGPLYGYTDRAAASLEARTPYIYAVLPDGQRGEGKSADAAPEPAPSSSPSSEGGGHG